MGWMESLLNRFGYEKRNRQPVPAGILEREFGVIPAASQEMEDNINLWYAMYQNRAPWLDHDVRSLGLPGAIGRELARHAMAEFSVTVSGSARAGYIKRQLQSAIPRLGVSLERGLCLGGVALKPYTDGGRIFVGEATTAFTPTRFDGAGRVTGGVFKSAPVMQGREWFVKLERHDLQPNGVYIVENRAFRSSRDGAIGAPVALDTVDAWAGTAGQSTIAGLSSPLFAYFKPPISNQEDPESMMGVSVYSGAVKDLIKLADMQWERIWWEFESGERKIMVDRSAASAGQFKDRLFEYGTFNDPDFFQLLSPELRNSNIYDGLQYILKIIEFNVGLAFGTISDPQTVNKTATEEIMTKHRQYVTEDAIQKAFQETLDGLIYAMNALCDLASLAPAGAYEVDYNWGDGILDDPETRRQDMAMGMQLMSAGVMDALEFRMKYFGEDEATARKMLPGMEELTTEGQGEVE